MSLQLKSIRNDRDKLEIQVKKYVQELDAIDRKDRQIQLEED